MDQRLHESTQRSAAKAAAGDDAVFPVALDRGIRAAEPDRQPPAFHSILLQRAAGGGPDEQLSQPAFFTDLNLDQIVAAVTAGKDEYDLKPFFHQPLHDADDVAYRHAVMQDLERPVLRDDIKVFADAMRAVREHVAQAGKLRYPYQKGRWLLDAVQIYCDAVVRLSDDLSRVRPASRGLSMLADHVARYVASEAFVSLRRQTRELADDLGKIHYTVLVDHGRVEVRRYAGETDYSADVAATFHKFEQAGTTEFAFSFSDPPEMNHIEAAILEQVAKLYPDIFSELAAYVAAHREFRDPAIARFDREIQFFVAYLDYIDRFKEAGLSFCYPRVSGTSKEICDCDGFDLALADRLLGEHAVPVCNDFRLEGRERIIVVSGPNQGGKTTFARTFGQLHYLASLGLPVPGTRARLFLFDRLFTHFEREEDVADLRGKLQDDLVRIHAILERATPRSIVVMNEIFTSTTFRDASALSRKIAARIVELDLLCVWVTFIDELAALGEETVSMVSTVVPDNPAERTFKIVRQPANGLAYALSIAERHRLTYDAIKERMTS
jgi:DNA mismatch repair protein MutS